MALPGLSRSATGYRFLSKLREPAEVEGYVTKVAALGRRYALPPDTLQRLKNGSLEENAEFCQELARKWFLGCPLDEEELRQRWGSISSLCLATKEGRLAGYCFGYSEKAVQEILGSNAKWREIPLLRHARLHLDRFSVVFQVAIAREDVGCRLAHELTQSVVEELRRDSPQVLWVLLWPLNLGGLAVAQSCGFVLRRTFRGVDQPFIWGELVRP